LGKRDRKTGVVDGKFYSCAPTPNCVSTQATDDRHKIEPLNYSTSQEEAKTTILEIINSLKRTKIITETKDYIHVEFRTALFRFVDDVEFYFDDTSKKIHFKSASRVGYSDMGINRKRMENIRNLFVK